MTPKTIQTLSRLNQRFYELSGSKWNPKPNYYWEGWVELLKYLKYLKPKKSIRVLDIGSGNGRFANFLMEYLPVDVPKQIEYIGIDFSVPMLNQITDQTRLDNLSIHKITRRFAQMDLIAGSIDGLGLDFDSFDLIVAFGLIHHIPSHTLRSQSVNNWAKYLAQNGLFVMTTWQYLDVPRLAKHCLDPADFVTQAIYQGLEIEKLEKGDNLLKWVKYMPEGQYTLRYSHYFEDREIEEILEASGLQAIASYRMDGGTEVRNKYWVAKKNPLCVVQCGYI